MSVAIYTDECVDGRIVVGLRARGVDMLTALEDGHDHTPDPVVLDRATVLGRLVFTQDDDFLSEAARRQQAGETFAGVAYGHQLTGTIGQYVADLELIAAACDPDEVADRVLYLPL